MAMLFNKQLIQTQSFGYSAIPTIDKNREDSVIDYIYSLVDSLYDLEDSAVSAVTNIRASSEKVIGINRSSVSVPSSPSIEGKSAYISMGVPTGYFVDYPSLPNIYGNFFYRKGSFIPASVGASTSSASDNNILMTDSILASSFITKDGENSCYNLTVANSGQISSSTDRKRVVQRSTAQNHFYLISDTINMVGKTISGDDIILSESTISSPRMTFKKVTITGSSLIVDCPTKTEAENLFIGINSKDLSDNANLLSISTTNLQTKRQAELVAEDGFILKNSHDITNPTKPTRKSDASTVTFVEDIFNGNANSMQTNKRSFVSKIELNAVLEEMKTQIENSMEC